MQSLLPAVGNTWPDVRVGYDIPCPFMRLWNSESTLLHSFSISLPTSVGSLISANTDMRPNSTLASSSLHASATGRAASAKPTAGTPTTCLAPVMLLVVLTVRGCTYTQPACWNCQDSCAHMSCKLRIENRFKKLDPAHILRLEWLTYSEVGVANICYYTCYKARRGRRVTSL